MATGAFIGGEGNVSLKIGDGAGSEVFTALEEVTSISGLGEANELVEATHFASDAKEYIAGLADGQEITVECNLVQGATQQAAVLAKVKAKENGNVQIDITDGSTSDTYSFEVTYLSWSITPSIAERMTLSFTMKISGEITIA